MTRFVKPLSLSAVLVIALFMFSAALPANAGAQDKEIRQMSEFIDLMKGFFDIIEAMHAVADDPEKATIFHLHKIKEAYEEQGDKARVVPVMREVLERSTNPTIRAATFLMLGDVLKEDGQRDEAIVVLRRGLDEALENAERGR